MGVGVCVNAAVAIREGLEAGVFVLVDVGAEEILAGVKLVAVNVGSRVRVTAPAGVEGASDAVSAAPENNPQLSKVTSITNPAITMPAALSLLLVTEEMLCGIGILQW
jgi:hypothetical protein